LLLFVVCCCLLLFVIVCCCLLDNCETTAEKHYVGQLPPNLT
jgi:hypothetical protein